jgi:hypothetical protein
MKRRKVYFDIILLFGIVLFLATCKPEVYLSNQVTTSSIKILLSFPQNLDKKERPPPAGREPPAASAFPLTASPLAPPGPERRTPSSLYQLIRIVFQI